MPPIISREPNPAFPVPRCKGRRTPQLAWTVDAKDGAVQPVALILVPMTDGKNAVLSYAAFARAMDDGYSDQFFIHTNGAGKLYVATSHPDNPGKVFQVSRIVARAGARTRVRFLDADTRNLTEANLKVGEGYSKGHEAAASIEARRAF